jgi:hypothetical protein
VSQEDPADGFTEDGTVHHIVPADSPLGEAMREARQSWGEDGKPDPETFDFGEPEPVTE